MSQNPTRLHEPVTSTSAPPAQQTKRRRRTVAAWAAPIIVGIAIALAPAPHGLPLNTWRYFSLFAAVMVGLITEPIPAAAVGLVGVVVAAASRSGHPSSSQSALWALRGFATGTARLLCAAYIFSPGYAKT